MSKTPPHIQDAAEDLYSDLLPEKSKSIDEKTYKTFMEWRAAEKINSFSENVLVAYFKLISEKKAPSTLWSTYSMLKTTINNNHNVNIKNYGKLITFLKKKSVGHVPKKSQVLKKRSQDF